eukprot:CAMPEP_0178763010 /NCGR_PEP_ID=MMETSP0744-20121128/16884_1 /TAXON_ID=913974 /ORGANISM="Nitzschia punctata, Strain CCMP561" /LENGTH=233 /DNA_ID=CAMNT_0020417799 /DNA_START=26 /DNA_END=727 /DNA_ORIENTATION=+
MAAASSKTPLLKVLTTPHKIASALDWRKVGGAILTLDIHADRIGLAVSHHPSQAEQSPHTYESLPLEKREIPNFTKRRLAEIVEDQNVCGFVVSWPVQNDTGKFGFAAGRTLYVIEQLLNEDDIITRNRPLCLWDGVHAEQPPTDAFGRSIAYARTCSKPCHSALESQYHQDEKVVAAQVWNDFMKSNWPDVYKYRRTRRQHDWEQQDEAEQSSWNDAYHEDTSDTSYVTMLA